MTGGPIPATKAGGAGSADFPLISVVIPARNEAARIGDLVRLVRAQCPDRSELEVIVVDDASADGTMRAAAEAGARVITLDVAATRGGNPAIARNRGAAASRGDPLVFLDADCTPRPGWLDRLLAVQRWGVEAVGGSLALPPGLPTSARCDYYCGWYHVHPGRPAGFVRQHPPGNLSVRRAVFLATSGYVERQPIAYAHEELAWQAELLRRGGRLFFEPPAIVDHYNRPGLGNLLRRNYRWGYSGVEAKAETGNTRFSWLYRRPRLLAVASPVLAVVSAPYIAGCWLRAGVLEPLWMFPALLAARAAHGAGMTAGGLRYAKLTGQERSEVRPRWE
jgi:glycosyltransferase involved in cell wall biosynthesis